MTTDPVTRLLAHAEALRSLSGLLDEREGGIACLLGLVAKDLRECGELLNDAPPLTNRPAAEQRQ